MPNTKPIKVKIIYRNYKPLHKIYESLVDNPPVNVEYIVPSPVKALMRFMFLYRRYKQNVLVKKSIGLINKFVFSKRGKNEKVDMYQFVNMAPSNSGSIDKPFIVDVERATSLTGFTEDVTMIKETVDFLLHPKCVAIVCMSKAAKKSLKNLVGKDWSKIKNKIEVIYPTIPLPKTSTADNSIIKDNNKLKLLFVGNQSGRKGLPDLLEAMKVLNRNFADKIELFIVSGDAGELVAKYSLPNVRLFSPTYSKEEMLEKFFLPADLFVFPTHGDTYGLAVVDALAAGTPVIATRQFALPELVDEGTNGLLIDMDRPALDTYLFIPRNIVKNINSNSINDTIVNQLVQSVILLVEDRYRLVKWSKNAREKFKNNNMLSITERNRRYLEVYKKALKSKS
jgi:glycosyltransferase involved in cell wall biosynthesis